jgi:hypothetical protein
MQHFLFILQAAVAQTDPARRSAWDTILEFVDTPAPYSPLSEYLLVLFLLWLLARHDARRQGNFGRQAQDVLDEKLAQGELSQKSYDKFRQDISLRPKN